MLLLLLLLVMDVKLVLGATWYRTWVGELVRGRKAVQLGCARRSRRRRAWVGTRRGWVQQAGATCHMKQCCRRWGV